MEPLERSGDVGRGPRDDGQVRGQKQRADQWGAAGQRGAAAGEPHASASARAGEDRRGVGERTGLLKVLNNGGYGAPGSDVGHGLDCPAALDQCHNPMTAAWDVPKNAIAAAALALPTAATLSRTQLRPASLPRTSRPALPLQKHT